MKDDDFEMLFVCEYATTEPAATAAVVVITDKINNNAIVNFNI